MTASVKVFDPKQPAEDIDYDISFKRWMEDRADAIASVVVSSTVLSEPAGAVGTPFSITSHEILGQVVRVFVSGGLSGGRYKVTARVTTANVPARVVEADIIIPVRER